MNHRFDVFFNPKSVVIIGASRNEYTFNGIVLKNLLEAQYKGKIEIVHPYTDKIMGIQCKNSIKDFKSTDEIPELAIILTQNDILDIVESLGILGIKNILIETDISVKLKYEERDKLVEQIKILINEYQLRILGPSMIGIIDFHHSFTSSVIPTRSYIISPIDKNGNGNNTMTKGISFLSQSGGLSGACGWWKPDQNVQFSKIIHIGKAIDIKESEILEYLFEDPLTEVIILYLNKIPKDYIRVLNKYKKKKTVLYKFVGKDHNTEQLFQDSGAIAVENYIELFEFAKVFLWCSPPRNNSVGIIGPSSGAINLLISEMRNQKIHLAKLKKKNRDFILENIGGSTCALGNPVDYWPPQEFIGTQICKIYYDASNTLLNDFNVGALFLALEFFNEIEFDFSIFKAIKKRYPEKPIITILIQAEKEGARRIIETGNKLHIPVFINEVERGIKALKCLLKFYSIDKNKKI